MNIYQENILDHYKNPHNKHNLKNCKTCEKKNPLCGDRIKMYIQIKDNKVKNISFEGEGCAISQATASMLTEKLKGKDIEEVKKMTQKDILNLLGIELGITRLKCALLPLITTQEAIC